MKAILISISILFLLPNVLRVNLQPVVDYNQKEKFDPALSHLNNINKVIAYADSIASEQHVLTSSVDYAVIVNNILEKRFYHCFSHYKLNQNWIAALGQYIFGKHLASIVDPDKIMKHEYAGCSQQSIVFMEIMNRKGFEFRSISFPHHFTSEFKIGRNWYFFDPNMEPAIPDSARTESAWQGISANLKKYYSRDIYPDLDYALGTEQVVRGQANILPAENARIFQAITGFLSKILWVLPLLVLYVYSKKRVVQLQTKKSSSAYREFKMPVYHFSK